MTKWIIGSVAVGIAAGYLFVPEWFLSFSDGIIIVCLGLILLIVGFDLGHKGNIISDIKRIGMKVFLVPAAALIGTLVFAALVSFLLPLTLRECVAVGAGFGWYSLAPMLLADYSIELSAVSFLSNIMREVIAILLIPIVAKRVGFLESVVLPGASSMDVCLPIIVSSTEERIAFYAFITGTILSLLVPILIPLIMIGY